MVQPSTIGHVVWHDLLTTSVSTARKFYAELLGWAYEVEHAEDFVWAPGSADYPLILDNGEAHGGFIAIAPDDQSRWLAFVAVGNVDDAARRSEKLGGTIERAAFDIPGVGRSVVIRDPQGATICPFVASHNYPAPIGVFIRDELFTTDVACAGPFYDGLFSWFDAESRNGAIAISENRNGQAQWVPYMASDDVDASVEKAGSLGAQMVMVPQTQYGIGRSALLRDPTGALFGLLKPEG